MNRVFRPGRRSASRRKTVAGFSLLELAVALSLVGLLTSAGLLLFKAWEEHRQRMATQDYLHEAKAALNVFARLNRRLPSVDSDGDGLEGPLTPEQGWLPYQTLGVNPVDAWGNPLRYSITRGMDQSPDSTIFTHATKCSEVAKMFGGLKNVNSDLATYARVRYDQPGNYAAFVPAIISSGGGRDLDGLAGTHDGIALVSAPPSAGVDDIVLALDSMEIYSLFVCTPPTASSPVGPLTPAP